MVKENQYIWCPYKDRLQHIEKLDKNTLTATFTTPNVLFAVASQWKEVGGNGKSIRNPDIEEVFSDILERKI